MTNKVYLVYTFNTFEDGVLNSIYSTEGKAIAAKKKIKEEIEHKNNIFKERHGVTYFEYLGIVNELDYEDGHYDEKVGILYLFQAEFPIIKIEDINIEEKEVQ